jgi:hypothetical protein
MVEDGRITAVGLDLPPAFSRIDAHGLYLVPSVIDSHVHLAYLPACAELASGGVAAAVDLGAPIDFLDHRPGPLLVLASGPMITSEGGYPTRDWGANGYGIECDGVSCAVAAVDRLCAAGADLIKVPVEGARSLDGKALQAVVERAHRCGRKVAAHALRDRDAALAASAGIDLLAHTPIEPLAPATLDAWSRRAVISTLGAFGGGDGAIANLRALHRQGAIVLYGTDLGNTTLAAIQPDEIRLLSAAGLDPAQILASLTSAPAAYWGLDKLGSIAPGKSASFLLLPGDPLVEPLVLAHPARVFLDGRELPSMADSAAGARHGSTREGLLRQHNQVVPGSGRDRDLDSAAGLGARTSPGIAAAAHCSAHRPPDQ